MLTDKPKSVIITIRNRKENKSKSITVYGISMEEVYKKIEIALKK
jgi:hypothetical protein